jgi:hypothetical protein
LPLVAQGSDGFLVPAGVVPTALSTIVKIGLGRPVGNNWQELVHVVQKWVKWAPTARQDLRPGGSGPAPKQRTDT